jgi:AcrR family transcriptional regulator
MKGCATTMADIELREVLLRTASRLFQERGYAAVSVRVIAEEARVTTGSLYYYFKDKDEIVREILDTGHRRVHEEVKRSIAALGPSADRALQVRVGIRAHLAALFEPDSFPAANVRIYAHVPARLRAAVRPGRSAYEQYWVALLSKRHPGARLAVSGRHLAMFLFGAANSTLDWYREGRDSLDAIATDLSAVLLGTAARKATSGEDGPRSTQSPSRMRMGKKL